MTSVAIGDLENNLPKAQTRLVAAYSSAWWDMRHAAQILHARANLGVDPADYFARRGLLDGAVITYARCFVGGRRTPDADLGSLVAALPPDLLEVHEAVMWWRDKHVGHRVDAQLESVGVTLLWGAFGTNAPTLRTRVVTQVRPDDPDFESKFEQMALLLANRIWEEFLHPLQQELLEQLGQEKLMALKSSAMPLREPTLPTASILVSMDIGSSPPQPTTA
jgi:hypothetical protein